MDGTQRRQWPRMVTRAVVIGAGGGIGAALVEALVERGGHDVVHALSRAATPFASPQVLAGTIDVAEAGSITAAAATIEGPVELVVVATGLLHEDERHPERALRELDAGWLARNFQVNAIGPALVLQQFAPLLPRDRRSVIACLSARVGSITDNRSGGWYGYRASKAALNMIVRTAAIELSRSRPQTVCVGLHPGTVDTALSLPFQARVSAAQLSAPAEAAHHLLDVITGLTPADTGACFAWDGSAVPP